MTARRTVAASLRLLSPRDRRLLGLAVALQMATAMFDLVGVAVIGAIGYLAMLSVAGQPPGGRLARILSALPVEISDPKLVAVLAGLAAALLITKDIVNPLLLRRIQRFLARRETLVATRLTAELLSRPLSYLHRRSSQETAVALLEGTNWAVQIVLGQAVVAASETTLLVALVTVILVINPAVAVGVITFFTLVGFALYRVRGHRVARLGAQRRRAAIASLTAVQEAIGTYREIVVTNRRSFYVNRIGDLRAQAAEAGAGLQLANVLPKYVVEGALVVGTFALAGVLFTTQPTAVAAGTFALVLASATRVMPSLLRLQTAALAIASAGASAQPTYQLADDLDRMSEAPATHQIAGPPASSFLPHIELVDVSVTHPGAAAPAIQGIDLAAGPGTTIALVGRSGAGKSTLADLLLGVLQPDTGTVAVGGLPPSDAVQRWPGSLAYVPQDVMVIHGSVRANVALALPRELVDDEMVWDALRRARLKDYVRSQPLGLDTEVGERGLRLSGGQRQRLGIARALFTRPRLLVLDEATSALDAETEQAVTDMLSELHGDVTTVIIAHRLSTIRHADLVVYLDKGSVLARGTFDEVCDRVPALRRQAALMGLRPQD